MTRRPERRSSRFLAAAALYLLSAPVAAADITPHAARYDLVLRELRMDGKAARSEGRLAIRVAQICEGWRISTTLEFWVETTDRRSLRIETVNGVEESTRGDLLSFSTLSRLNGDVQAETKGAAEIRPGAPGRAVFTAPSRREVVLPKDTLFPAAGGRLLLDRLIAGRTQVQRKLFDGSTGDPFEVLDTVAPGRLALAGTPSGDGAALLRSPSWRLQSLWTRDDGRETVQRMELQLHANGVTSRMIIDLGLVVLEARLTEIERLSMPPC